MASDKPTREERIKAIRKVWAEKLDTLAPPYDSELEIIIEADPLTAWAEQAGNALNTPETDDFRAGIKSWSAAHQSELSKRDARIAEEIAVSAALRKTEL